MTDFLLELRSEEIPARMQAGARAELEKLFRREMDAAGVAFGELTIWSTPRRLALIARAMPEQTQAVREEAKGPPEGAPDAAIDGFCRKLGIGRDALEVRDVKGRNTYFAVIDTPGRAVKDVLAEAIPAIIRDFSWPKSQRWGAASISTESLRWVRPLSGIVALLGDAVVECDVHGITSGRETKGHRFHSATSARAEPVEAQAQTTLRQAQGERAGGATVTISNADDYAAKLRDAHVIVDHEERQNIIRSGAAKAAADAGLVLVEDEGLVIENAGLTEWPVPLLGRFEDDFLEVPPETIQLTARVNQKYFVCEDAQGQLANAFICTANIEADDPAVVVDGNRKVLAARLSDAKFFWDQDRKTPLAEHAKKLERITFHEKLGTVADKVERVAKLARWLCEEGIVKAGAPAQAGASIGEAQGGGRSQPSLGHTQEDLADLAEQAARLCKADLVTEMVGEFPELQGLMGGYYARAEGLSDEVADAIRDHYKPVGQGDDVPTAPVTVAVSLADKLDTLAGFFAIEEWPTGSKDPFALRRAAISVIQIILVHGIRFHLYRALFVIVTNLVLQNMQKFEAYFSTEFDVQDTKSDTLKFDLESGAVIHLGHRFEIPPSQQARFKLSMRLPTNKDRYVAAAEVFAFIIDRLKVQQREAGVRHDLIDAVFALGGEDDLVRLLARVHALQAFVETGDGVNLLAGYKRAANILKKEEWDTTVRLERSREASATGVSTSLDTNGIDAKTLSYTPEPAEKALMDALDTAAPQATAAIDAEDFAGAMAALATLRSPIDEFFTHVTVNDADQSKRANRLDLLARFRDAVHQVADFSRIEG